MKSIDLSIFFKSLCDFLESVYFDGIYVPKQKALDDLTV